MGSYGTLHIGKLDVASWKNWIPLEPSLLFVESDSLVTRSKSEDDVGFFGMRTTVKQARERLDTRGITFEFCQRFFGEFRSEVIHEFIPNSYDSRYISNQFQFEDYLQFLKAALRRGSGALWNENDDSNDAIDKSKRPPSDLFSDDAEHFDDAFFVLQVRLILELAEPSTLVELDLTDLKEGGWLSERNPKELFKQWSRLLRRRIELNYQLYGFVVEEDPRLDARLRSRIKILDEDSLLEFVVMPLLERMGFEGLRKVAFHGREEFGRDVMPFRQSTPFGTFEYVAVQTKAAKIHGTSSRQGNAGELMAQAQQALRVSFVDEFDNERKRIDKFVIIASATITPSARRLIEDGFEGNRQLVMIDLDRLVALIRQYRLYHYVLFSDMSNGLPPKKRIRSSIVNSK
ncbi:MAG TPA: HEPN/Toprim-associated domain-containing protein [Verrucomicrobiae bacterium]|nr:HEPN/Toprim-associated domain-containing protein [Verrucomicrobiae bacterium]